MTQKRLIAQTQHSTHIRFHQMGWDSYLIRLRWPDTRNGARLEYFCAIAAVGADGDAREREKASERARAENVVCNPAICFGMIFSTLRSWFSARFVDCVPRTMMMTLVYEITIDLSTHNYMHWVCVFIPCGRDFLQFIYKRYNPHIIFCHSI